MNGDAYLGVSTGLIFICVPLNLSFSIPVLTALLSSAEEKPVSSSRRLGMFMSLNQKFRWYFWSAKLLLLAFFFLHYLSSLRSLSAILSRSRLLFRQQAWVLGCRWFESRTLRFERRLECWTRYERRYIRVKPRNS